MTTALSDDGGNLLQTGLLALAITIVLWYIFKPTQQPQNNNRGRGGAAPAAAGRVAPHHAQQTPMRNVGAMPPPTARRPRTAGMGNVNNTSEYDEDSFVALLRKHPRMPPHFVSSNSSNVDNSSITIVPQHEGILPFRYTLASTYESKSKPSSSTTTTDVTTTASTATPQSTHLANRKDRARLFTKLFLSSRTEGSNLTAPPSRGSNIVISIPSSEVGCVKLSRVLYLLGSYYNLFILMNLEDEGEDEDDATGKMDEYHYTKDKERLKGLIQVRRGGADCSDSNGINDNQTLPEQILPSHRIVTTTSLTGKVAFVRQLHFVQFVLDYEEEMQSELQRFGFTVLLYSEGVVDDDGDGSEKILSGLGMELCP